MPKYGSRQWEAINNNNPYFATQPRMFLREGVGGITTTSLSAAWVGRNSLQGSLIWAVCFAQSFVLSPYFLTSTLHGPGPLSCVSQEIKLYFLSLLFFSKWGGQIWSPRHLSEPGVETLRLQPWVHNEHRGQFARVIKTQEPPFLHR